MSGFISNSFKNNSRLAFKTFMKSYSAAALPPVSYKPQPYEGPSYEEVIKSRRENLSSSIGVLYKEPVMLTQGYMQYLWDHTGKRYLDMFGGIVTVSVGHCHPKIVKAATDQMNKLWHLTNIYLHPKLSEYTKKLLQRFPDEFNAVYYCNSGSEANDLAMKLARLYTGSFDILALRNAYHGDSPYSGGLCGIEQWKHNFPNGFGIRHAMNPDPYRGTWGGSKCRDSPVQSRRQCDCDETACRACDAYIEQLQETLSLGKKIAAFFAESIQGVGGTVQFPKGYLKKAYELVRERGGLCIADEVQTGFGRTGKYWGFESHGVVPDIVTLAKGIGNGFPLAAVVTRREILDTLNLGSTFNTFGGNPLACAIGSAVLDVIDEDKLMQNSEMVGTHLLRGLANLRDKYEIVGDVRGKGLMIGVELVENKESKKRLSKERMDEIFEETKNMGLLLGRGGAGGNTFRIKPPMCVTKADADFCISVLDECVSKFS